MKNQVPPESSVLVSSISKETLLILLATFSVLNVTGDFQALDRSFSVSVKIEISNKASNLRDVLDVLPNSRLSVASLITKGDFQH